MNKILLLSILLLGCKPQPTWTVEHEITRDSAHTEVGVQPITTVWSFKPYHSMFIVACVVDEKTVFESYCLSTDFKAFKPLNHDQIECIYRNEDNSVRVVYKNGKEILYK